jgi:glutamate--cysteine ligase
VYAQQAKIDDPTLTPSGQIMELVEAGTGFIEIAKEQAKKHQIHFASLPANVEFNQQLETLATQSLAKQASIEASDELSFDDFLERYNKN